MDNDSFYIQRNKNERVFILAGNPNVGKSTLFNFLTGLKQHTGNWTGKTVENAVGRFETPKGKCLLADVPGTYSLEARSAEEEAARDIICGGGADGVIVVCDAGCLERNLNLVLQIREITHNLIVCVNLMDEAVKKGITVDLKKLEEMLGLPVYGITARTGKGVDKLIEGIDKLEGEKNSGKCIKSRDEAQIMNTLKEAEKIAAECVKYSSAEFYSRDRKIDRVLTHRIWGVPIMLALLGAVFLITIYAANYPSQLLSAMFDSLGVKLRMAMDFCGSPLWLTSMLCDGIYRVLTWVIAVMLPPMAVFFPMFTLLEDLGYLPRVAFNLDRCFKKAGACGKQSLTMAMGFGCNAVGVTGCRIIDSPRERLIAILTNSFVPCNGRFPALIALITMFFADGNGLTAAVILTGVIITGVLLTLAMSKLLSMTLLKGVPSSFVLELPPYRTPQAGSIIVRSLLDRTVFVLGRAVAVAAPAGFVIWLLGNVEINGTPLLAFCSELLDPLGNFIGLDGVILLAFILGFPANEIVIPLMLMIYMSSGTLTDYSSLDSLKEILVSNGWTSVTAICTMVFMLCHFPCSTTMLTIKKETGSLKWTALAFILPLVVGTMLCFGVSHIAELFI